MNKKFIAPFLILLLLTASCKESDPYEGITRYMVEGAVPSLAADMISMAKVYEYRTGEVVENGDTLLCDIRIDSNIIDNPSSGTEYLFLANTDAEFLKVKLISKEDTYRWGDTIIHLIEGDKVLVRISPLSPQTKYEPMLNE